MYIQKSATPVFDSLKSRSLDLGCMGCQYASLRLLLSVHAVATVFTKYIQKIYFVDIIPGI